MSSETTAATGEARPPDSPPPVPTTSGAANTTSPASRSRASEPTALEARRTPASTPETATSPSPGTAATPPRPDDDEAERVLRRAAEYTRKLEAEREPMSSETTAATGEARPPD